MREASATRIQARARGNTGRAEVRWVAQLNNLAAEATAQMDGRDNAAIKIQSRARGKVARTVPKIPNTM